MRDERRRRNRAQTKSSHGRALTRRAAGARADVPDSLRGSLLGQELKDVAAQAEMFPRSREDTRPRILEQGSKYEKGGRAKRKSVPWPESFCLDAELAAYARTHLGAEAALADIWEHFFNHHDAIGSRFRNWRSAWRKWVLKEKEIRARQPSRRPTPEENRAYYYAHFSLGPDERATGQRSHSAVPAQLGRDSLDADSVSAVRPRDPAASLRVDGAGHRRPDRAR